MSSRYRRRHACEDALLDDAFDGPVDTFDLLSCPESLRAEIRSGVDRDADDPGISDLLMVRGAQLGVLSFDEALCS